MAQPGDAQHTESQASEEAESDDESRLVEINLVRDSQEPLHCDTCGKHTTEEDDGGDWLSGLPAVCIGADAAK